MATTKKYVSLEKLGLYDEKIKKVISDGDAAALASAKEYAEGLGTNYDAAGAAATVQSKLDEEVARAKAAEEANAAAAKKAQDEVDALELVVAEKAAQSDLDALEEYVGTIPEGATSTNVVAYVQEKTAGIATSENLQELTNRVAQAETDIDNIEKDYLKAADKTELQGKIDAEAERAAGIEGGLETRLKAVEDDYLKAADKTELQGNIDTLTGVVNTLRDGVDAEKVDGVKDLIDYVEEHGTEVTGMKEDISKNAEDITGVTGRMTTAEGKITAVEGAVATKAEQSALDEAVEALEGADAGQVERIAALEAKFADGEGSVADMIADAKQEAIDAAAGDATTKANTAESNAKAYTDTEVGKDRTRLDALEADTHTHANKALLDTYTQTEANLADAVAKKHAHSNMDVLEAITAAKVSAWDAAEQAAKTYADGLNTAMDARMVAVETWQANMVECSETDIADLFA